MKENIKVLYSLYLYEKGDDARKHTLIVVYTLLFNQCSAIIFATFRQLYSRL